MVQSSDQIIDQFHDQVIIIATLPELKSIAIMRVIENIVFQCLKIIHFSDLTLQCTVDSLILSHRVLDQQVSRHSFFDVLVNASDFLSIKVVALVQTNYITYYTLRTIYLCVFVAHVPRGEMLKS